MLYYYSHLTPVFNLCFSKKSSWNTRPRRDSGTTVGIRELDESVNTLGLVWNVLVQSLALQSPVHPLKTSTYSRGLLLFRFCRRLFWVAHLMSSLAIGCPESSVTGSRTLPRQNDVVHSESRRRKLPPASSAPHSNSSRGKRANNRRRISHSDWMEMNPPRMVFGNRSRFSSCNALRLRPDRNLLLVGID
jgi:hypothetical protein